MNEICKIKDIYKTLYLFEKSFLTQNGITINEGMLLCCLQDGQSKTANELSDFIGLSNSRVSRVINSTEEKGYILRQMGVADKRLMFFTLSESGLKKAIEMQCNKINFSGLIQQLLEHTNIESDKSLSEK